MKPAAAAATVTPELKKQAATLLANLPMYFEPNRGQTDPRVTFLAKAGGARFFLTGDSAVFLFPKGHTARPDQLKMNASEQESSAVVRMRMVHAERGMDGGLEQLPGVSNYFIGSDSSKWVTGVPQYGKVKRLGVYPGVDMVFYGNQHQLEYDFVVSPGADPNRIELAFDGVDGIRTNAAGDLVLATSAGEFIQHKPKVYQQVNGREVEVASNYRIGSDKTVHFELARYDRRQALVIDPTISFTFNAIIGSSSVDFVGGMAIDSSQNVYVTGSTLGTDFPLANPYQSVFNGTHKIFIFKMNSSGTALLYSTLLGGSVDDFGGGIGVDSSGNAYVGGTTYSSDYPVVAAAQAASGGQNDGVVSKLSPSGGALLYSTYLGGSLGDAIVAVAVDPAGSAYVAGVTQGNFPVSAGVVHSGGAPGSGNSPDAGDCLVAKYGTSGNLVYSTHIGGGNLDKCAGIAFDAFGDTFVTGVTQSSDYSTTAGAFLTTNTNFKYDAFVTKINPTGTALLYSTYYAGTTGATYGNAIAVDANGAFYITGNTTSTDLPGTTGFYQASRLAPKAAFVVKFISAGTLSYATYFSGSSGENGFGIAVDSGFNAYIVGSATSSDLPRVSPVIAAKPTPGTDVSGFVAALNPSGTNLVFSSFLGVTEGTNQGESNVSQIAAFVAVDPSNNVYVAGQTDSLYSTPTSGGLSLRGYGGDNVYIAKLSQAGSACAVSVANSTIFAYGAGATALPMEVYAPSGCAWSAGSTSSWISFPNGNGATGSASFAITVAANPGAAARTGTVIFSTQQSITVNQGPGGCTYTFNPAYGPVAAAGGTGSAPFTAGAGCTWSAVASEPWITINNNGTGSAVSYTAAANNGTTARSGLIAVGGSLFTLTQTSTRGGPTYVGKVESSSCTVISGWAADENRLNQSIGVSLWYNNAQVASTVANILRPDIGAQLGDNGLHGFSLQVPLNMRNAGNIVVQVDFDGTAYQLVSSPVQLTCRGSGGGMSKVGAYNAGYWVQDLNGNFSWDGTSIDRLTYWSLGLPGEIPVYGDWNGDGRTKIGLYVNGTWLLDYNGNGVWDGPGVDKLVYFGGPGYTPVVGDWNGSGTTKIGAHQNGTWLLDYNGNFAWDGPSIDKLTFFGGPGYTPVLGDWNGSGTTKIGVHQNGTWLIDYNGNFSWDGPSTDKLLFFGGPGYTPVVGDWNGSGTTKIGAHQNGTWLLDYNGNFAWDGPGVDQLVFFGGTGYTPVVGDWNGSGTTKIAAYLNGLWVIDVNGNFMWDPPTDKVIFFGGPGQTPVVGKW